MQMVVEFGATESGLRGEVRIAGGEPTPFAGWLEFLALVEAATRLVQGSGEISDRDWKAQSR